MDRPLSRKGINFVRCLKCHKILNVSRFDTAVLLEHIRNYHTEVDIVDTEKVNLETAVGDEPAPAPASSPTKTKIDCSCLKRSEKSHINFSKIQDDHLKAQKENELRKEESSDENSENSEEEEEEEESDTVNQKLNKNIDSSHHSLISEIMEKYPEIKECEYCPRNPNARVLYTRRYKVTTPTAFSISSVQVPKKINLYRTSIEKWRPANGTIFCPKCGCNRRPLIKTRADRLTDNQCGACCLLSCWPFCFLPCLIPGQSLEYLHCSNCRNFLGLYDRNKNCIRPNRLYANKGQQKSQESDSGDTGDEENVPTENVSDKSENESLTENLATENKNQPRLPTIVIDGKELHPDMVARLQKLKKYSRLAGIDLDDVIDKDPPNAQNTQNLENSAKENGNASVKAPSIDKTNAKSFT